MRLLERIRHTSFWAIDFLKKSPIKKHVNNIASINKNPFTEKNKKLFSSNEIYSHAELEARHEIMLNLDELLKAGQHLLSDNGEIIVIFPADRCDELASELSLVRAKTGLVLDPYFSGSKMEWLLQHGNVPNTPQLALGTIDSWIIWNLTQGAALVTDASNASRTMLFDITTMQWSTELCSMFGVPMQAAQSRVGNVLSYWSMWPPMVGALSTRYTLKPALAMSRDACMPAMPPPAKAMAESRSVQRAASSRLRAM